jgi:hypothetical protein
MAVNPLVRIPVYNRLMATSTGQMMWQAFEQLPDGDGFHREVVEGELIVLPPDKSRHALITAAVARALLRLESCGLWSLFVEAGYRLSTDPPTWIQPGCGPASAEMGGVPEPADGRGAATEGAGTMTVLA